MRRFKNIKIKMNNGDVFYYNDISFDYSSRDPHERFCGFFFNADNFYDKGIFVENYETGVKTMINKENISSIEYEEEEDEEVDEW